MSKIKWSWWIKKIFWNSGYVRWRSTSALIRGISDIRVGLAIQTMLHFFYKNQEISTEAWWSNCFTNLSLYVFNFALKLFLINIEDTWWSSMVLNFTFCHYSEAGMILSLFLNFDDFEPRFSYELFLLKI